MKDQQDPKGEVPGADQVLTPVHPLRVWLPDTPSMELRPPHPLALRPSIFIAVSPWPTPAQVGRQPHGEVNNIRGWVYSWETEEGCGWKLSRGWPPPAAASGEPLHQKISPSFLCPAAFLLPSFLLSFLTNS